jgi:acylphosphatase
MQELEPNHALETIIVHVTGRVQGVGFRFATVRRAHMEGVGGWVRNNDDGSVEALVQGTPEQVDNMLEWMRQGPPNARVDEINSRREYTERRFPRFEQQ